MIEATKTQIEMAERHADRAVESHAAARGTHTWQIAKDAALAAIIETQESLAEHRASSQATPEGLRSALERLSRLTPFSANAGTVEDFAATVHAIADTALAALTEGADHAILSTPKDAIREA